MNQQTTGNILKSLRESRGLSQQQVANALKVERTTYVKYETGAVKPTRKLKELANFYNVSIDQLFGTGIQEQLSTQYSHTNYVKAAIVTGEIMSMYDDKKIELTIEVLNRMKTMSTEQIKKLNDFLKVMK